MNIFLQSVWYLPKKISFWKGEGKRIWSLRKIYTPANKYTTIITLKLFSSIFFINFGLNFLNFKVSWCLAGWGSLQAPSSIASSPTCGLTEGVCFAVPVLSWQSRGWGWGFVDFDFNAGGLRSFWVASLPCKENQDFTKGVGNLRRD